MTREEAKRAMLFAKREVMADSYIDKAYDVAIKALGEPERKKGKWIKISPAGIYECSVCGLNVMTGDIDVYSWCHGCGAKMEWGD